MAIKFAPKDPAKEAAAVAAAAKATAAKTVAREQALPLQETDEDAAGPETGDDLFGAKSAGKRRKK